jgi:two-component system copper resistance phosphate regulon response regulator CusR
MLTALDSVTDRVIGLDAGADDYLPKPFEQEELLARVRALLRRATLREDDVSLHVADLTLEPLTRRVTRGGEVLTLTQKEYALLEYLMRHVGHIVTRDQITTNVWKPAGEHVASNVIDVYISYLRAKIDAPGRIPLLHTIRGTGYLLSPTAPRSAVPR